MNKMTNPIEIRSAISELLTMYPAMPYSPLTELSQPISATATDIEVVDGSAFPPAPNLAVIGIDEHAETILYRLKIGNTLSQCVRGVQREGEARSWSIGASIARRFTAKDQEVIQTNLHKLASSQQSLEIELREGIGNAITEMNETATELTEQMTSAVAEFKGDIAQLKEDVHAEIAQIVEDLDNRIEQSTRDTGTTIYEQTMVQAINAISVDWAFRMSDRVLQTGRVLDDLEGLDNEVLRAQPTMAAVAASETAMAAVIASFAACDAIVLSPRVGAVMHAIARGDTGVAYHTGINTITTFGELLTNTTAFNGSTHSFAYLARSLNFIRVIAHSQTAMTMMNQLSNGGIAAQQGLDASPHLQDTHGNNFDVTTAFRRIGTGRVLLYWVSSILSTSLPWITRASGRPLPVTEISSPSGTTWRGAIVGDAVEVRYTSGADPVRPRWFNLD